MAVIFYLFFPCLCPRLFPDTVCLPAAKGLVFGRYISLFIISSPPFQALRLSNCAIFLAFWGLILALTSCFFFEGFPHRCFTIFLVLHPGVSPLLSYQCSAIPGCCNPMISTQHLLILLVLSSSLLSVLRPAGL